MESQIPRRIPRILPLVGHGDDVLIYHVEPFAVPHDSLAPLHRIFAMLREPFVHVKEEELLGPEHTGHRLAQDAGLVFAEMGRGDLAIKLARLALASLHSLSKTAEHIADGGRRLIAETQADGGCLSCAYIQLVLCSSFGPRFLGIHSVFIALNHVVVDSVFDVRRDVWT